jgi:hypothetical protein
MNIPYHISVSLDTIFWVKILKGLMRIRIRDKHPGTATLEAVDPVPISNKKLRSTLKIRRILCPVLRIRSLMDPHLTER